LEKIGKRQEKKLFFGKFVSFWSKSELEKNLEKKI